MDRKIWLLLSLAVRVADKRVPQTGRHCRFDDRLIVRMFLWAAFHDCAPLWAGCHADGLSRRHAILAPIGWRSRRLRTIPLQTGYRHNPRNVTKPRHVRNVPLILRPLASYHPASSVVSASSRFPARASRGSARMRATQPIFDIPPPFVPPCLRRFVASCLRAFVPSCLRAFVPRFQESHLALSIT